MSARQLPALGVLLLGALALVIAETVDGQAGALVLGLALLLAGGLRLALPARRAGALVVRTRGLDATLLLGLGFALVLLANSVPDA